jgi:hypothetical protein
VDFDYLFDNCLQRPAFGSRVFGRAPRIRFEPTTLQLQLIDHVIIGIPGAGRSSYFSFKEAGVIS